MALKSEQLSIEEKPLDCPLLKDVAHAWLDLANFLHISSVTALKDGLSKTFETVEVDVVDCPDLQMKPFSLASQGLNGSPTIVEFGGVPYLMPLVNRSKVYNFKDMNQLTGVNPAFIVGAGAGPFTYAGTNCELIANSVVQDGKVRSLTQIAKLKNESKGNDMISEILPDSQSDFALMGNFFVSEGKPGKVLKIQCKTRIDKDDFATATRETLLQAFPGKSIGVGGAFLMTGSKVKQHVMPDFSSTPLETNEKIDSWLRFYNMTPPLVAVGTFVTNDPGLNLRTIHFHSFSDHGEGGHYHYDIEPEKAEYLAYFNLGSKIIRVDRPSDENKLGHN